MLNGFWQQAAYNQQQIMKKYKFDDFALSLEKESQLFGK